MGEVTFLRAVERSDLAQLLEWRNNSELRMYFREHRLLSTDQQTKWFEEVMNKAMSELKYTRLNRKQNYHNVYLVTRKGL